MSVEKEEILKTKEEYLSEHSRGNDLEELVKSTKIPDQSESERDLIHNEMRNEVLFVHLSKIQPNPEQPRKVFIDEEIKNLAKSVSQDGVLQPLIVAPSDNHEGSYILIAGERRLRASKLAGLKKVPVIVKMSSKLDIFRIALIENIQRSDLNIIEEARAYEVLINDYGLTQEQCAEKVGKDRSTVANALRILSLPKPLHEDLCEHRITMGHARALLSLGSRELIMEARAIVLKKSLNVRRTEALCKSIIRNGTVRGAIAKGSDPDPDLEYIADNLRTYFRTKVKISGGTQRGKIELSYFSASELERVLGLINKNF